MAKNTPKTESQQPEAQSNVTVITAPQAIAAYKACDLETVEQYCKIAGQNALKGIVAMRDELRQKG